METVNNREKLQQFLETARRNGKQIALVPTMGNLHAGHIELFKTARRSADVVVGSLFVNPMQFGENEDLDSYPRTLREDQQLLEPFCDILYAPKSTDIYPEGVERHTTVEVPGLSENFCGASRPVHFRGVATVVTKLLSLVKPHKAFFGLKDYQQYLVIKKLNADLVLDCEIIGVETQRADDGLALSSRNNYLSHEERAIAPALYRILCWAGEQIQAQQADMRAIETQALERIAKAGLKADYFAICNANNLAQGTKADSSYVILAAAYLGSCRLIDNLRLETPAPS